jgi:2-(1,2-epoxy-1,2-dihydrophenyl)acetyl-CoA isomerase
MTSTPADEFPPVAVTRAGAVATVRLQRPQSMNALDLATKVALRDAVLACAGDAEVRCVVLTGSGRAFCVGQDLREHTRMLADADPALWRTVPEHYNPIALALATMPKPVVAAVNGIAAGAGAGFALAADQRLFAASAGLNLAFTQIGLSADSGTTWWLPRLVGIGRAKELLMAPRTIPAAECLELGIATEVVPDDALADRAARVAATLAAGPTVALGAVRRAVAQACGQDLAAALEHEAALMDRTGGTQDHAAAVEAFLAKAVPRFSGR